MRTICILSYILCIAFLFNSYTTVAQSPLYQSPCSQIVWQDEFDGPTLDASKWSYQTGDGCPGLCGWGNGELEWYTDRTENVKIENGKLIITALEETMNGKNYTSGRIRTENQGDFTFGRIEARIKMPIGKGLWPAFWMLPTDYVYGGWPYSGEIDIVEYVGQTPTSAWGTLHYAAPTHKYSPQTIALPGGQKYSDDFHVFAIEWDSTSIKWFMDGTHYHTMTPIDVAPGEWVFKERFHIILNVAVGGLGGTPDATTIFPQTMEVDYVRVYSNPLNTTIKGKTKVFDGDNTIYSLSGDPDITNYQWQVPSGATITSGQGTDTIEVTWGSTSGDVTVIVSKSCDDFTLTLPITVFQNSCEVIYEDFQTNNNLTYAWSQGTYSPNMTTINQDSVNSSSLAGKYVRSAESSDRIIFNSWPIEDVAKFESGEKIFYLDVYSNTAPIGTKVEIQLHNSAKASGTFPAGRRNTFIATTSLYKKWERLLFKFDGLLDAGTLPAEIDHLVLIFDPGSTMIRNYYFDNFKRGNVQAKDITGNDTLLCSSIETYSVPLEAGSGYNWSAPSGAGITGQGTNEITVNWGTTSGYLTLTETNSAACQSISANLLVTLTGCTTGLQSSISELQGVNIYPNPVHSHVSIECNLEKMTDVEIVVKNTMGKDLFKQNYSNQSGNFTEEITIQEFQPGIYVIQISTRYGSTYKKFVKD